MKVKVSNVAFSKNQYLVDCLLKAFPDAEFNTKGERLKDQDLVNFFSNADAAIVGLELITPTLLDNLPKLKVIAKYGVGLDNIDLIACKKKNVKVGWTGGVNKRAVSEMALGFMLALSRNLFITSNQLKQMVWNKSGGMQLTGKIIGLIGLGNIAKELINLLQPFNCTILANDIIDQTEYANSFKIKMVSKEEIYKYSDIISIHTPLTQDTKYLINEKVFKVMKPTAFLINTARGGIINETDLKFALENKLIAGAALDVYEIEPPMDQDLLSLENLICTPHTGGNSYEAVVAMGLSAIDHLIKHKNNSIE